MPLERDELYGLLDAVFETAVLLILCSPGALVVFGNAVDAAFLELK